MRSIFILKCCCILLAQILVGQRPEVVLQGYEDAHNSHDVNAELSYLVKDVQFDLVGSWTKKGIGELSKIAEWDARLNSQLDFHIQHIKGDSIFCSAIEKNDWLSAIGLEMLEHPNIIFVIKNGLIHHIMAYPSEGDRAKINDFIINISNWSHETGNSTLDDLLPGGHFIYSASAASQWLELINQWKKG